MKYESTRGGESNLSFEEVLFAGYAKDGGLYLPESVPEVSPEEMQEWRHLSYGDLVFVVLRKFISTSEITDSELRDILKTCFERFDDASVIGVHDLGNGASVFELFHGPTLAFKDLALFVVSALLEFFIRKKKRRLIALVGTSGDTGSSAMESVRGRSNIDIIVLLPKDRCTAIQRLQMTTIAEENAHVYCVEGSSDDLDVPIKQCFQDPEFVDACNLISMNSINVGRILSQIPIYIFAYYRLSAAARREEVEIIVPTGAAGSITAGCIARKMGFPLRLVPTVNINQAVARSLSEGIFCTTQQAHKTFSSAMDIQMPYNLERIFYLFSDRDAAKVKEMMESVELNGSTTIPKKILASIKRVVSEAHVASDHETTTTMKKMKEEYKYFVCPHTATALSYFFASRFGKPGLACGVLATASPEKFPEAIEAAGLTAAPNARIKSLFGKQENFSSMKRGENWFDILRKKILTLARKS